MEWGGIAAPDTQTRSEPMRRGLFALWMFVALLVSGGPARAQTYTVQEIVREGHGFFGAVARGLGSVVEQAFSRYGQPNGYILGQEATGAVVGGLRYGEGMLFTKNAGRHKVYWQGPSVGFDFGADGARTMILVYNLPAVPGLFERFGGIDGSAYFVSGVGMTALARDTVVVAPIRSGVGLRLGVNLGYLKFSPEPTWNPF